METWHHTLNGPLYTYNPKNNIVPDNIKLSGNLSPLTNFFLNVFINSIDEKNLIIGIPTNILRPIPIISYLYANLKNKSVIIFTQKGEMGVTRNPVNFHNRNYHLLNENGRYVFNKIPMGIMSNDSINAKIYVPRAKRSYKKKYIEQQKNNFLNKKGPKVLLYHDENNNRIPSVIKKITLDEETVDDLDIQIDLGLAIFENVDRFVHSQYYSKLFLNWIYPLLKRKIHLLFHFSNPSSSFTQIIKDETNSLAIPFGHSLLRSNAEIRDASMDYFKNRKKTPLSFLERYNIDPYHFYGDTTEINVMEPQLESGNIDYHFRNVKSLRREIDETTLINKGLYFKVLGLAYKLPNLSINPSKYKECYGDNDLLVRHYTIPQLLSILRDRIPKEDKKNRLILKEIISEIFCIYSELKECKRFGEDESYSRIAKDCRILEEIIIEIASDIDDESKLIIATYSPTERNILKGEILNLPFSTNYKITTIKQINQSIFDKSNSILILPGPLRMKFMSELLKPYMKIMIITYDGENYLLAKNQIDLSSIYSFEQEKNSMLYLGESYDFLGLQKDGLFKNYYDRIKRMKPKPGQDQENNGSDKKEDETEIDNDITERIKEIMSEDSTYDKYKEHEDEVTAIETSIEELENEKIGNNEIASNTFYEVLLRKVNNMSVVKKLKLPVEKTYLYQEKANSTLKEGTPRSLKEGFFVVILDNDERKTILELIFETFDLEESVEKYWIEAWKERLAEFIERYDLPYAELHKLYTEKGGKRDYQTVLNWAKGGVIGPDDKMDLFIIGKILEDEEIMEDYEKIDREVRCLREIHRNTGRKLRRIVKEIVKGDLDSTKLSYEELILYEKMKDGVYKIDKIMKCNNNDNREENKISMSNKTL